MGTPLARRLKSAGTLLRKNPSEFELHQAIRVLRRAHPSREIVIRVGEHRGGLPRVQSIDPGTRSTQATIHLNPACFADEATARRWAEGALAMHESWECSHPFAAEERGSDGGKRFVEECGMFASVPGDGFPPEYLAFAAGAIRRGVDVAEVCAYHFGVRIALEAMGVSRARLRVGPLSLDQYTQFLPDAVPSAGRRLLSLAAAVVGPAAAFEVTLVLDGDEVPGCVPGGPGAVVGETAWPGVKGRRGGDVQRTFTSDEWYSVRGAKSRPPEIASCNDPMSPTAIS